MEAEPERLEAMQSGLEKHCSCGRAEIDVKATTNAEEGGGSVWVDDVDNIREWKDWFNHSVLSQAAQFFLVCLENFVQ